MQCATSGIFLITIGQHLIHLLKFENSKKLEPSKKMWGSGPTPLIIPKIII